MADEKEQKRDEPKRYFKICLRCGGTMQTVMRNKRNCPRCGGTLRKDEKRNA